MTSLLKKHTFNLISFDPETSPNIEIKGNISRINKLFLVLSDNTRKHDR